MDRQHGFIDYGQNKHFPNWDKHLIILGEDELKVKIVRHLQFFAVGQDITLGKLREYFTEKALMAYKHDNFIEIIENER